MHVFSERKENKFSTDILEVEVRGPKVYNLVLMDLPGVYVCVCMCVCVCVCVCSILSRHLLKR